MSRTLWTKKQDRLGHLAIVLVLIVLSIASCRQTDGRGQVFYSCSWPLFLHDTANTSFQPLAKRQPVTPKWSKQLGVKENDLTIHVIASPVISGELLFLFTCDGFARSVAVQDGHEEWKRYLQNSGVGVPLALNRDHLFVNYAGGALVALDTEEPTVVWKELVKGNGSVVTPLTCTSDNLYVSTNDGSFMSISSTTGQLKWNKELPGLTPQMPCIAGEKIFVGCYGGGDDTYFSALCLDQETGDVLWKTALNIPYIETPFLYHSDRIFHASGSSVYSLNSETGAELWSQTTGGYQVASPLAYSGSLVVPMNSTTEDKWKLISLNNSDGRVIAEVGGAGRVVTNTVTAPGFAAFGTDRNEITIVDLKSWTVSRTLSIPAGRPMALALTSKDLVVTSENGWVSCFGI